MIFPVVAARVGIVAWVFSSNGREISGVPSRRNCRSSAEVLSGIEELNDMAKSEEVPPKA
jgi:hypothetical protein